MKRYKIPHYIITSIKLNDSTEGETIEDKVTRALTGEEGIDENASIIYTERKDGVLPEYNPRADKWEIAVDAMTHVNADNKVRRLEAIKKREEDAKGGAGEESGA